MLSCYVTNVTRRALRSGTQGHKLDLSAWDLPVQGFRRATWRQQEGSIQKYRFTNDTPRQNDLLSAPISILPMSPRGSGERMLRFSSVHGICGREITDCSLRQSSDVTFLAARLSEDAWPGSAIPLDTRGMNMYRKILFENTAHEGQGKYSPRRNVASRQSKPGFCSILGPSIISNNERFRNLLDTSSEMHRVAVAGTLAATTAAYAKHGTPDASAFHHVKAWGWSRTLLLRLHNVLATGRHWTTISGGNMPRNAVPFFTILMSMRSYSSRYFHDEYRPPPREHAVDGGESRAS
nr:hypothetical protein CFP56_71736 [Quercus suber]